MEGKGKFCYAEKALNSPLDDTVQERVLRLRVTIVLLVY